jgi:parallel beta-helix repeat protein
VKIEHKFLTVSLLLSTFRFPLSAFSQGSLTPPGAPAPTMKSLDQIEARTVVNAVNLPGDGNNVFIIRQSGSYYLTTNLLGVSGKNEIEILANNVTLDLNGFTLAGVAGSGFGIVIPASQTNLVVRSGTISGWGNSGVYAPSSLSLNLVFERLNVSACAWGFQLFGAVVVRDCNSENNTGNGFNCAGGGIISGCTANNNGDHGIRMIGGTVSGCFAQNNGNNGIYVAPGTVAGCLVQNNGWSGVYVDAPGSAVIGNTCLGNNASKSTFDAGIFINDSNNRVEDNHVTASGYAGIQVAGGYLNNVIIKNTITGNTASDYLIPSGHIVGPLINTTGTITNANPWANFSF